jgi:hypothetical protein
LFEPESAPKRKSAERIPAVHHHNALGRSDSAARGLGSWQFENSFPSGAKAHSSFGATYGTAEAVPLQNGISDGALARFALFLAGLRRKLSLRELS